MSAAVDLDRLLTGGTEEAIPSLEELVTVDFQLTNATPLQRAICRIADGLPLGELKTHPHVIEAIGPLPKARGVPLAMLLLCAIRAAKSTIAAAAAFRCALTCDVSQLSPGEIPRVSIISVRRDQAKVIMDHIRGALRNSPRLRALLIGEPQKDTLTIRHPSGRPVEIVVDAGARAGSSLVGRWMAAVLYDEAPRMVGASDGVINLDDSRAAVAGRFLDAKCAREWIIGSPWAPFGPVYQLVTEHHGRSTLALVCVRARGDWMNPVHWTPKRIAEVKRNNPLAYQTDFLAEFADLEEALMTEADLEACTRKGPLVLRSQVKEGYSYAAEMDPATRSNAWTLVIAKTQGKRSIIVFAKEWRPRKNAALSPDAVLKEIAGICLPYEVTTVGTDQWSADAIRDLGKRHGLRIVEYTSTGKTKTEEYLELAARVKTDANVTVDGVVFEQREIELPDDPVLLADLRRLRRKTLQNGLTIDEPKTSDGRHCDFGPSIRRVCQRTTRQPKVIDARPPTQVVEDQWRKTREREARKSKRKTTEGRAPAWWRR